MKNLKELIRYATKAPSGHNSQPWKFKIDETSIEIHPDFDFALPIVDPTHRELYVGLGCATENLCQAASSFGYSTNLEIQKSPKGIYFINITLKESSIDSDKSVLQTIEKRQSNKAIYNGWIVSENLLDQLKSISQEENINAHYFIKGSNHFSIIKNYIKKGNTVQMNDDGFKNELLSWMRFNKSHVKNTNNGLTYKVMGSPSTPKFMGRAIVKSFLTPEKQNKSDVKKIDSSSHFVILTTKTDSHEEWVKLGMYLE
ncbi:Acg family FMN-binding oxidoreductase [Maribacter sp. ACAM166]|uniref:Acg family FMN-binding oxidoreductase n=1 Tax=Maribacter sp. ACAM166 TaxID=2508996 RepID=UPI001BB12F8C|nr:nitroreductase [Maribacter sp. ACAM166]